eukprot:2688905-Alexandrium_andersonii.AAC.1
MPEAAIISAVATPTVAPAPTVRDLPVTVFTALVTLGALALFPTVLAVVVPAVSVALALALAL